MADFAIMRGGNLIGFGPAGVGKTEMAIQRVEDAKMRYIYLNLSVIEAPDLVGLPYRKEGEVSSRGPKTAYAVPEKFDILGEGDPAVLVVDELDKARPELQNPMLEVFQYRSVNGVKLNIKAVIATGNLPDENAFSAPVSHALTNRCSVYRVTHAYDPWQQWAVKSGINALVIGFLSRNQNLLLQPPPSGDDTAYVHCSPRSWTNAARDLDAAEDADVEFQTALVAGRVGSGAASSFRVWLDHHRHIQSHIDDLVKEGKHPPASVLNSLERQFVFGIAGVNEVMSACQRADSATGKAAEDARKRVHKITDNVMGWVKGIPPEYSIGAMKSVLSMDAITKHRLMDVPSFMEVFVTIRKAWSR